MRIGGFPRATADDALRKALIPSRVERRFEPRLSELSTRPYGDARSTKLWLGQHRSWDGQAKRKMNGVADGAQREGAPLERGEEAENWDASDGWEVERRCLRSLSQRTRTRQRGRGEKRKKMFAMKAAEKGVR